LRAGQTQDLNEKRACHALCAAAKTPIERLFVRQSLKFRAAGHGGRVEHDGSRRHGAPGRR